MKISRIIAAAAAVCICAASFAGCSSGTRNNSSDPASSGISMAQSQDGLAEKQIDVSVGEEADEHETVFKLNSVIDSGEKTEDGQKYIYLNVTIKNTSSTDYDLNVLNNFYLLLPDKTELSFDIRTQIYALNHFKNFTESPFIVPAGGEFTGYIGGFLLDESISDFTVCFFPTQNDRSNKSSVVKCPVKASDMVSTPDTLIG
ncbi:MAG: DUF4352 domain-containing protein [Ruminococcus sp.]|nr:DUF4352 domain-containing protein [Ruminococcus sp.]